MTSTLTLMLGAGLLASLVGNAALVITYRNLQHETMTDPRDERTVFNADSMRRFVYGNAAAWLWHPEARGISRMRADFAPDPTNGYDFYASLPTRGAGETTAAYTAKLLLDYLQMQPGWLHESIFHSVSPGDRPLLCDENAAIFRSILMGLGIQSRVVNFQFGDGDGGAAHTALEVWLPETRSWIYVDPHYGAYSSKNALDTAADLGALSIIRPDNKAALVDVFTNGIKDFRVEGHTPRQRFRLMQ